MRKITSVCAMVILILSFISVGSAEVIDTVTAEEAFDAYMAQKDPDSGDPAKVILVDIRTTAEFYWIGTCAKVTGIWTTSDPEDPADIVPDNGKVQLVGEELVYNEILSVLVEDVQKISTSPIAINIPYQTWRRDKKCAKVYNPHFRKEIEALADFDDNGDPTVVIILTCRSGKRTSACVGEDSKAPFDLSFFKAVYEIDHADKNAHGGIQGSSYSNMYNGFRGFPGRDTSFQSYESVSWYDAGLPIHIGAFPE